MRERAKTRDSQSTGLDSGVVASNSSMSLSEKSDEWGRLDYVVNILSKFWCRLFRDEFCCQPVSIQREEMND